MIILVCINGFRKRTWGTCLPLGLLEGFMRVVLQFKNQLDFHFWWNILYMDLYVCIWFLYGIYTVIPVLHVFETFHKHIMDWYSCFKTINKMFCFRIGPKYENYTVSYDFVYGHVFHELKAILQNVKLWKCFISMDEQLCFYTWIYTSIWNLYLDEIHGELTFQTFQKRLCFVLSPHQ